MITNIRFRWLLVVGFIVFYAISSPFEAADAGGRFVHLVWQIASGIGRVISALMAS